jgi:purine-binding chemotaxis protein CheW
MAADQADPIDALLRQRHSQDAQVVELDEPERKLVIFRLAGALWAAPGEQVREILPPAQIFFVPGCPEAVEGVINVRGDIASVIRLDRLLALEHDGLGASILLCRAGGLVTGLRVGEVVDVVDLPASAIQPPPGNLASSLQSVVTGAFTFQRQPVTLLDLEPLLGRLRGRLAGNGE